MATKKLVNTNRPVPKDVEMSQEAYDNIKKKLEILKNETLPDILDKVSAARAEGDLKENGGYHAAREAQKNCLTKIAKLESDIKLAKIVETKMDGTITEGNLIKIILNGNEQLVLVGNDSMGQAFNDDYTFLTVDPSLPLAKALIGKKEGEKTSYETKTGATIKVEIKEIIG